MYKQALTRISLSLFLFLGLVSCNQKSGNSDNWDDAPKIIMTRPTADESLVLSFGDRVHLDDKLMLVPASFNDAQPLSSYDQIPGGVVSATAVSHCKIGDNEIASEHLLSLRTEWSVAELLPLEFWRPGFTSDNGLVQADCELMVRLANQYGSTRTRHINRATVTGQIPSDENWIRALDVALPNMLDYYKADLFIIPASNDSLVLSCSSFADQTLGAAQTLLNQRLSSHTQRATSPLQSCRLLEINQNGIVHSTQAFKVKYPSRDLQVELFVALNNTDGNLLYRVKNGLQYKITNPEPFPVQVRIRKQGYFYISFFGFPAPWVGTLARSKNQQALTYLVRDSLSIMFEDNEHVYVNLQPAEQITFGYDFSLYHNTGCGVRESFGGFDVLIPNPDTLSLIARANVVVGPNTSSLFESSHDAYPAVSNGKRTAPGRLPYFIRWEGSATPENAMMENISTEADLTCWTFE